LQDPKPHNHFSTCPSCKGQGKKRQRLRKRVKLTYERDLEQYKNGVTGVKPVKPRGHLSICKNCQGSGLITVLKPIQPDVDHYPHLAIVGGGIGGVALAVACLHRGIPFTLFERDSSFNERSQGYGLTLQQASKAMEGFGITELKEGIVSTKHIVHKTNGTIIGEWGIRKWLQDKENNYDKRTNIHIARQSLRLALLDQLPSHNVVQWGHKFIDYKAVQDNELELRFEVNGIIKTTTTNLLIGADGIRSKVRKLIINEDSTPLRYLDCMVILGICPYHKLDPLKHDLLDSATVFQTANGHERIYMMPYNQESVMWQLSFPMLEEDAKKLSALGPKALKEEACRRTQWHDPIPQIMAGTTAAHITGYPVYDRALLNQELLKPHERITLLGDAAHPMSPFKGQGANQALLDALSLARSITKANNPHNDWRKNGLRSSILNPYENEMIKRSGVKVKASAQAAEFLHTDIVLHEANEPRGRVLKRENEGL